jgi:hypothetical protein
MGNKFSKSKVEPDDKIKDVELIEFMKNIIIKIYDMKPLSNEELMTIESLDNESLIEIIQHYNENNVCFIHQLFQEVKEKYNEKIKE